MVVVVVAIVIGVFLGCIYCGKVLSGKVINATASGRVWKLKVRLQILELQAPWSQEL